MSEQILSSDVRQRLWQFYFVAAQSGRLPVEIENIVLFNRTTFLFSIGTLIGQIPKALEVMATDLKLLIWLLFGGITNAPTNDQ